MTLVDTSIGIGCRISTDNSDDNGIRIFVTYRAIRYQQFQFELTRYIGSKACERCVGINNVGIA